MLKKRMYMLQDLPDFKIVRKDLNPKLVQYFYEDQMLVDLAIYEAYTNAFIHGNKRNTDKMIQITLLFLHHSMIIRVRDEGEGFSHKQVKEKAMKRVNAPLEDQLDHGRGLIIMHQMMDSLHFSSSGNEVIMRKWYTSNRKGD
ncbi:hypothetical protein CEY16_08900 [Halalkalibacillus sediminis]|uniref:Histidine kinase/HSP90-like ATPase domain-containing protein n=1 Tax=Halalkalibacillus sediminis TaxID=2018042 RepID=A0A2I0QUK8_9BACI|nr:ATP-binding protein [Halalkalibacillus sediminis]PKR78027.1 hypothetical protein CEY16_08900 [Halalkalibacillus sediminis]